MIDRSALRKAFCPGVPLGAKFVPESVGAVAPMGIGEGEKLARHKVAGMRRNKVDKAGFCFGVTESFQGFQMRRVDVHKDRVPVTS